MKPVMPALLVGVLMLPLTPAISSAAEPDLRLNHVQVLGSHNSYKRLPADRLVSLLDSYREGWADSIHYEHRPLQEQLQLLGIRQFELDVFADPDGGLFAEPAGGMLIDDPELVTNRTVLQTPGLKVLHSQDVDYRTTCLTLVACLTAIRDWSVQHPRHLPIMVMLELKDAPRQDWGPLNYTTPQVFDASNIFTVDDEIWQVFARDHVITPDDVRGSHATLNQAIMTDGWPTLADSRGKILFALDNTGRHLGHYLSRSEILAERALFVSAEPGHPASAFLKMNNVIADGEAIKEYAAQGYLIRTRSDVPTQEARTGDTTRRDLALDSGAQYVSTDYAEPSPFGSGYQVLLPDTDGVARCNPVTAPPACRNAYLSE
ncbi:MAG: phosphatidylinositol-specific phospholipase C1-like protein [Pseudohongiella sp.]